MDNLDTLQVYKELADWYERQGQAAMRDRFLILAVEAAFSAGKTDEAERLRQRLLQANPHHMLKPFSTFAQALQSSNIQIYIHDLQTNYPTDKAQRLLHELKSGHSEAIAEIPQTAPLILFPDEPTLQIENPPEPPKVIPLHPEPEPTQPATYPLKPTEFDRPAPRKPKTVLPPASKASRPAARDTAAPRAQPTVPRPAPRRSRPLIIPPEEEEVIVPAGAWLTYLLFGMTVTAGLALAVYTLARPFLPPQWLP